MWFYKRGKCGCFVIAVARGYLDVAIAKKIHETCMQSCAINLQLAIATIN